MPPKLVPNLLLAKSKEGAWKGSYSLVGHTADVVNAVTTLIDTLGEKLITQFGLECSLAELKATARLAAYLHDWGKANDHFQGVVRYKMPKANPRRNPKEHPQLLRHEALSVLLAWEFKDWLEQADGDFMTALAAAGGHHLKLGGKAGQRTDNVGELRQCGDDQITLFTTHRSFISLLKYGRKTFGFPSLTNFRPPRNWKVREIEKRQRLVREAFEDWNENATLLAILKGLLICGDSIGSAAPSADISIMKRRDDEITWIEREVNRTLDGSCASKNGIKALPSMV